MNVTITTRGKINVPKHVDISVIENENSFLSSIKHIHRVDTPSTYTLIVRQPPFEVIDTCEVVQVLESDERDVTALKKRFKVLYSAMKSFSNPPLSIHLYRNDVIIDQLWPR